MPALQIFPALSDLLESKASQLCRPLLATMILIASTIASTTYAGANVKPRFIIPGGLHPNSVDPLDLDQFANYFPGQMIYLPPLEASLDGKLTSRLLSDFQYDEHTNLITLKMAKWHYSDGSPVTIEDVALAIKRMTLKRPSFPVIRFIDGISDWLKTPHPLAEMPKGMRVVRDTLTIKLSQKVYHPLFRFSLNIFAVIPSHCVDLKTSKLTCEEPPSSGYYLAGVKSGTQIEYKLRTDLPQDVAHTMPQTVTFEFANKDLQESLEEPAYNSVGFGYDLSFTPKQYQELEHNFRLERLPSAWFSGFILNSKAKPFADPECRLWFADKFRQAFAAQDLGIVKASSSVFTSIIPGHKSDEELKRATASHESEARCLASLRAQEITIGLKSQTTPPFVQAALDKLSADFKIKFAAPVTIPANQRHEPVMMQLSNSGFWALDPVGDVQMLLAPNMHDDYVNIAADPTIRQMLKNISVSMTPDAVASNMAKLNVYLHDQALLNVFSNQGYFYISSKSRPKRQGASFSVTVPYPWQVF